MHDTEANGWMMQGLPVAAMRAIRLASVALGIGLVMTVGVARAQENNDDDDMTFEEKIIDNIMRGVGGKRMGDRGIDYRERSPLVVPPKLDLPPPESAKAAINDPNWPKDPDERARKAAIAARKKSKPTPWEAARVLTPAEMNAAKTAPSTTRSPNDQVQPGQPGSNLLSPAQLGYNGGLLGMFRTSKTETAPFKGEPNRQSLTEPPAGYRTPSPNYAYGTGPNDIKSNATHTDIMTGKEVPNY